MVSKVRQFLRKFQALSVFSIVFSIDFYKGSLVFPKEAKYKNLLSSV